MVVEFIDGKKYKVDFDGNILEFNESQNIITGDENTINNITIKISISGTEVSTPPIPSGFEYKEGNVNDGYVIVDASGNEFVWIPVYKNQRISLEVSADENISSIKLYDPSGNATSYNATGTSYQNSDIVPTTNGAYIVTAITESGKAAVKLLTTYSLYANTINFVTDEVLNSIGQGSVEEVEELFASYGTNVDTAVIQFFEQNVGDFTYEDTANYKSSVELNGGFYIGRYEAGATTVRTSGNSSMLVEEIIDTNGVPVSKANVTPYNYITQSQAIGLAESMYEGKSYTCSLLTGSAWDRVIGFLTEEGENNKSASQVYTNSNEWGNYNSSNFTVTNTSAQYSEDGGNTYNTIASSYNKENSKEVLLTTGAMQRNSAKNIYDLAGNVWEYTLAKNGDLYPVIPRGGSSEDDNLTSFYRGGNSDTNFFADICGFRLALYL